MLSKLKHKIKNSSKITLFFIFLSLLVVNIFLLVQLNKEEVNIFIVKNQIKSLNDSIKESNYQYKYKEVILKNKDFSNINITNPEITFENKSLLKFDNTIIESKNNIITSSVKNILIEESLKEKIKMFLVLNMKINDESEINKNIKEIEDFVKNIDISVEFNNKEGKINLNITSKEFELKTISKINNKGVVESLEIKFVNKNLENIIENITKFKLEEVKKIMKETFETKMPNLKDNLLINKIFDNEKVLNIKYLNESNKELKKEDIEKFQITQKDDFIIIK